jgi:sugar O-acyltransferase (sialic acid O-acetyltransferase NeuD family)
VEAAAQDVARPRTLQSSSAQKESLTVGKVVLFGNKSAARETYNDLTHFSDHEVVGFTVDREYLEEDTLFALPVVPFDEVASVFPPDRYQMLIAVGYVAVNRLRAERYLQAKSKGYQLLSFVSPRATTYPGLDLGDNCRISHNCVIFQDAKIGNDVAIGAGTTIGHEVTIGDHCFLSSGVGVSGGVTVGPYCFLGTNATIRNRIHIGRECVIGAGALVLEDVADRSVCLGTAAELLPISSEKLSPP